MLCHPDRISATDDPEKVYIANRCFAALTEAYNLFKVNFIGIIMMFHTERSRYLMSEGIDMKSGKVLTMK